MADGVTEESWDEEFDVDEGDVEEEDATREVLEMAMRLASLVMDLEVGDVLVRMPDRGEGDLQFEIRKPVNEEQRAAILAMKTVELEEEGEEGEEE